MSRERLVSFFWPESDEDRARNALNQVLHGVRRELGEQAVPGASQLRIDESIVASDVGRFRAAIARGDLQEAASLYTGPFLDGVYLKDAAGFERWAEEERHALAAAYGGALEQLAADASGRGDRMAAVRWWQRRAETELLSARIARGYIAALVDAGDRDAALAYWRTYVAAVRAEVDADPDPDLAGFVARIRAATPVTAVPGAARAETNPGTAAASAPEAGAGAGRTTQRAARTAMPARGRAWIVAVAAGILAAAGLLIGNRPYSPGLVVVAPFENETGDSAYDAAGRLIADWITQGLLHTQLAEVVDSRTVARAAFDTTDGRVALRPPATVARETGAGTLVRGILFRKGDSLLVQAQIENVGDERVIRRLPPVTVALSQPGAAMEPLRQLVLGAFSAVADPRFRAWSAGSEPPRYDAYLEFMRGVDGLARGSADETRRSLAHLANATRLDTSFVLAMVMLAEGAEGVGELARADSVARAAVRRRDRLSPWDRATLDRFTAYREGDWPRVYAATTEMVRLAPTLADSRFHHAWASIATNRYEEAIRNLHAIDVDRGWLRDVQFFWKWEMMAHHLAGDYAGAAAESARARERHPGDYQACIAGVDHHAAEGDESASDSLIAACGKLPDAEPAEARLLRAASEYAHHGHAVLARRAHARALAAIEQRTGADATPADYRMLARAYAGLGRHAEAYAAAKRGFTGTGIQPRAMVGIAAARAGDRAAAAAAIRAIAAADSSGENRLDERWIAQVHAALGNADSALVYVHRLLAHGVPASFVLHATPGLLPLRGDPRYERLLAPRRR